LSVLLLVQPNSCRLIGGFAFAAFGGKKYSNYFQNRAPILNFQKFFLLVDGRLLKPPIKKILKLMSV